MRLQHTMGGIVMFSYVTHSAIWRGCRCQPGELKRLDSRHKESLEKCQIHGFERIFVRVLISP